jgi:outer membrane lipoprotein-sorting protein
MINKFKSLLILLFISSNIFAQNDVASKTILAALNKKFNTYDVVKIDFSLNINNLESNSKETQNGVLYLKAKSNQYKITLPKQDIFSDGKSQWTYLKKDNEVQLNTVSNDEDALNPAKIFSSYNKGYKSRFIDESKIGANTYQNLELAPLTNKSFSKIKMAIDKNKHQLYALAIYGKDGMIYTYTVKKIIPVKGLTNSFFVFDKKMHLGVDFQDLR